MSGPKSCTLAAVARPEVARYARELEARGDVRYVPRRENAGADVFWATVGGRRVYFVADDLDSRERKRALWGAISRELGLSATAAVPDAAAQ